MNNDYYSKNSKQFIEDTFYADMSVQYAFFEKHLNNAKTIMDLGFGSGRDSLYFMSKGYDVYSVDPTKEFCDRAIELGLKHVYNICAQDMYFKDMFDGIWACASLLHVPSSDLNDVFKKCAKALKKNGMMYVSFKLGNFEGERKGRYFLDLDEESLDKCLSNTGLEIKEKTISVDVRPEREEKWLNVILAKGGSNGN